MKGYRLLIIGALALATLGLGCDGAEKAKEKINDMKLKDTSDIIFGEVLRKATNKKNKSHEITDFFKVRN